LKKLGYFLSRFF
jgi:hypothetical protein